jgi:hypothetical protein
MDFDTQYSMLSEYLTKIEAKFLTLHIADPLSGPDAYDLDVKSYCVLCHAAFEEFIEKTVLNVMSQSIEIYSQEQKISKPIISLMHFKGKHNDYIEENSKISSSNDIESFFEYTRKKLVDIKSAFSKEINDNHGVSLKYLRKLLIPVAIDIPKDPNWSNSLEQLTNARGAYAHKFLEQNRIKQSIAPEDAKRYVQDCLDLCEEINNRAKILIQ